MKGACEVNHELIRLAIPKKRVLMFYLGVYLPDDELQQFLKNKKIAERLKYTRKIQFLLVGRDTGETGMSTGYR